MGTLGIAITGASGLIGARLVEDLRASGHVVHPLRRSAISNNEPTWNPETGEFFTPEPVDVLVHLAGRSVAARWTGKVKREIRDSRIPPTEKLSRHLAGLPSSQRPKLFIAASAIGIYGDRGDEELTESSTPALPNRSFLADVCRAWETAARPAHEAGIRVIHPRIGIVLAKNGGALGKLLLPTKLGLAGPIGPGTQFMSWISLTDLSRLFLHLMLSEKTADTINVVAPHPVRQHEFVRTLGNILHRPTIFPMPSLVVKLVLGEMGKEMLLASQRVLPMRVPTDFQFQHPTLDAALRAELAKK
jgi:uncharacterized protein (TIGR01777 family)